MDTETQEILCAILEILKAQAIHLSRQEGWITVIAGAGSWEGDPKATLEADPLFRQARDSALRSTNTSVESIDALIVRLKDL